MPPIRTQSSQKRTEQDGRILLAIQAIQNQEFASICEAARQFNVPRSTLITRLNRVQTRAISRVNNLILIEIEEEYLEKWILSIDSRRVAPRPSIIREIEDLLLTARRSTPCLSVG
jgi:transcriptional antiterminator